MQRRVRQALSLATIAAAVTYLVSHAIMAQNVVRIDGSAPVPEPAALSMTLGSSKSPDGHVIGGNSQYLTMDGKPWIPVMGEFHYSRYPAGQWEEEILKMKAAGVQIVATYVIWIHHEQNEGVWNWTGQRDLKRFAAVCAKHGVYLYPRIGPWAHAETRNGGLPDWVVKNSPTRQNDPVYLGEVQEFYAQIASQLKGALWKDGGPVIGIQIENEYNQYGAGKGANHIKTLKQMAIKEGLDVPLYTVTGWDDAAIPLDAALPVFGGYPDAPWDGKAEKLPPNEVYAFRFDNRSAGSMGAIGGHGQSAAATYSGTPFLTAEIGDGIQDTYFRRPVVSADDVAAIAPVMLGSGANMLGYYMFHGGRNPEGGDITLQESQRTGSATDVPVKSYDFQAPLGEFGQERESLRKLKLVHYFLNDFGDQLAPMAVRRPVTVPVEPGDLKTLRVSARTSGDRGFLFFNNHVRGASMPARDGFQVELKLPSGTVHVPTVPTHLPSGAYGIWPVNMALPEATLYYSTAQLFKRAIAGSESYYFFTAIPGIVPEFALDDSVKVIRQPGRAELAHRDGMQVFSLDEHASGEIVLAGGTHLVCLPMAIAEQVWRVDDVSLLLRTGADFFSDGSRWTLQSMGNQKFDVGLFGSKVAPTGVPMTPAGRDGLFEMYHTELPSVALSAQVSLVHPASAHVPWQYGPKFPWRPQPIPRLPDDAVFHGAAEWRVKLPAIPANAPVADMFISIQYQGDVGRLYRGKTLVDDSFWNGLPWEIGMREVDANWRAQPVEFRLQVLPLKEEYPMYIEEAGKLIFEKGVTGPAPPALRLIPNYELVLKAPESNEPNALHQQP